MHRSPPHSAHAARHLRGVAAIEFIILLPALLLLLFGMVNLTQYMLMNRRINIAAELVADLVTRHESTIPASTIDDYFTAVELAIRPLDISNVRIALYDYFWDGMASKVRWSKSSTNGRPCNVPAPVDSRPNDDPIVSLIRNGDDVVVAVVCMPFTPPSDFPGLGSMFAGLTIEKQVILKPRQSLTLTCTLSDNSNCP